MVRNRYIRVLTTSVLLSASALMLLTGCSKKNKSSKAPGITGSIGRSAAAQGGNRPQIASKSTLKASPLVNETTRLSEAFEKNPANAQIALNYIYRLRSLGMGQRAVSVLHKAYQHNPKHPVLASEYGRLMLGSGKTVQAKRILDKLNGGNKPTWQTLSALGTIEARNGSYGKATHYFQQARELAPKRASILNNLALSLALDGKPDEAENLLRNADDSGRFGARLRQNLALVLALQGKFDDAQAMATTDLPPAQAKKNIAYLKKMLRDTDSQHGIEFSDDTGPLAGTAMAGDISDGPATTSSIGAPTQLTPIPETPAQ
jgi:Flp pilus assembly protein TadD